MDDNRQLPDKGWKVGVKNAIEAARKAWEAVRDFDYEKAVREDRAQELETFLAMVAAVYHLGLMDDDGLKIIGQSILCAAHEKEAWADYLTDETYRVIVEAFMPMTRPLKLFVHHLVIADGGTSDFSYLRGDGVKLCMDLGFIDDTDGNIAFFRDLPEEDLHRWLKYLDERRNDFSYGEKVAETLTNRICAQSDTYREYILHAMALVFTPTDTISD